MRDHVHLLRRFRVASVPADMAFGAMRKLENQEETRTATERNSSDVKPSSALNRGS